MQWQHAQGLSLRTPQHASCTYINPRLYRDPMIIMSLCLPRFSFAYNRSPIFSRKAFFTLAASSRRYRLPTLDNVEEVEDYWYGGFHPISLGDTLGNGRYRVLHKLGFGGSATVWLARDQQLQKLVSVKVTTAEVYGQCREFSILQHLMGCSTDHPGRAYTLSLLETFTVEGPNGTHLCLVQQVAGPSVAQLSFSPGEADGSLRLRSSLAHKMEYQMSLAIGYLHSAGIVHGGIVPLLAHLDIHH